MGQKSADIDNSEKKLEISEKKKLNLIKDNFDKKSKISVKNQMQLKNFLELSSQKIQLVTIQMESLLLI